MTEGERRAAVAGKPIAHSLLAADAQPGVPGGRTPDWRYTAVECAEVELADLVGGLGPEWSGLSCTMPLKQEALAVADAVSPLAAALGAANTLVRRDGGWYADNTDAPGMVDALRSVGATPGGRVSVLGAGGTARAALAAARDLGAAAVTVTAAPGGRRRARPSPTFSTSRSGSSHGRRRSGGRRRRGLSTVPEGVADKLASAAWGAGTVLRDAVYDPWPTPLAVGAARGGSRVLSGLDLLLAQGVRQFEIFTGVPAPVEAMRAALLSAQL